MSNAVVSITQRARADYDEGQIALIRDTVMPPDTPPAALAMFLETCARHQLDPLIKQIWAVKIKGKIQPVVARDGLLAIGNRHTGSGWQDVSGEYLGCMSNAVRQHDYFDYEQVERDDGTIRWAVTHKPRNEKGEPTHGGPDGSLRGPLVGAWAIVRRRGHNDTWFYAEWDPYVKSGDNAWRTHPTAMIQKCAESNTLRRAFSVSGVIGEGEEPKDAVSSVTQSNSEASSEIRWPADEGLKERLKDAFDLLGYRRAKVRSLVNACRSNEDYLNLLGDLDNALTEAGLTQVDDAEVVEPDAA